MHSLQRRIPVEELTRRRGPEEGRRYAASQRSGRIDPNPDQLDAVVFALRRIPEGGCILADELTPQVQDLVRSDGPINSIEVEPIQTKGDAARLRRPI